MLHPRAGGIGKAKSAGRGTAGRMRALGNGEQRGGNREWECGPGRVRGVGEWGTRGAKRGARGAGTRSNRVAAPRISRCGRAGFAKLVRLP